MKLLIDTHLLLWAAADLLPVEAVPYFENEENLLYFSPASIWEIIIKKKFNRSDFQVDPFVLYSGLLSNGYSELDITSHHVLLIAELPPLHKDPFDRILVAQARAEGAVLLTADKTLSKYPSTLFIDR